MSSSIKIGDFVENKKDLFEDVSKNNLKRAEEIRKAFTE